MEFASINQICHFILPTCNLVHKACGQFLKRFYNNLISHGDHLVWEPNIQIVQFAKTPKISLLVFYDLLFKLHINVVQFYLQVTLMVRVQNLDHFHYSYLIFGTTEQKLFNTSNLHRSKLLRKKNTN